jgi:hypothetical protein
MAERGVRRLILLGRTRLPERGNWEQVAQDDPQRARIDALLELEALGAQVALAAVDLTRPDELAAWLQKYTRQGGRPIRGVLHAAVHNEDRLLTRLDAASLQRTFLAKATGALSLAEQLPELDFLIFFSSVIALFGPAGTGSYAAANAYLDALAGGYHASGSPVININWSVWGNLGLARKENIDRTVQKFQDQGIGSFSAAEGLEILGQLIDRLAGQNLIPANLAVIPMDWRAYRKAQAPRFGEELFARRLQEEAGPALQGESGEAQKTRLEASTPEERRQLVTAAIEQIVRRVFHLTSEGVDFHRPLGLMGMDSLMGIELRNQMQARLGVKLPVTFVWNYPTLHEMVERFCGMLGGEKSVDPPARGPVQEDSDPPDRMQEVLARVSEMSDEEAFQKLVGGG